jgi:hypothetical protein
VKMYPIGDMIGLRDPGKIKSIGAAVEAGTRRGVDLSSPRGRKEMGLTSGTGLTIGPRCNLSTCGPPEGARSQGRRTMTIVTRHVDHMTFNVLIAGCGDMLVETVHEGKDEI